MEALYLYPTYFDEIFQNLIKRNWLVHNFNDIEDYEVYDFSNYLRNKDENDVTYTIFLDLNIYQYIINSYKKEYAKDEFRDAIG